MEQILYLECQNGISGDMMVAALLDLGADPQVLKTALNSLPIKGFRTEISRVKKAGLDTCDFNVVLDVPYETHDHDMDYLHGHSQQAQGDGHTDGHVSTHADRHIHSQPQHEDGHTHSRPEHEAEHMHSHSQPQPGDTHTHRHVHRHLDDILAIIQKAAISDHAKQIAEKIFTILGQAEAKAHGTSIQEVHFHEVGAIDSIVDIIAAAVCLDNLGITDTIILALHEGTGTIRCQHGILPIPVPAVANIIQAHGLPLHITGTEGEFVTPTGAAIAAAIRTGDQLPEQFRIIRTGLGAGKRSYERPSILRAMLIEPTYEGLAQAQEKDVIYKLESNLDDCTGEALGHVLECLMEAGARDVHYFPLFMKKNRPAYQLNVICKEADIPKLEQVIFKQTTTIGIRRQRMERSILPRELKKIQTAYGEVQVKVCGLDGQVRIYPEYDSLVRICRQTGSPYMEMYHTIQEICRDQLHLTKTFEQTAQNHKH